MHDTSLRRNVQDTRVAATLSTPMSDMTKPRLIIHDPILSISISRDNSIQATTSSDIILVIRQGRWTAEHIISPSAELWTADAIFTTNHSQARWTTVLTSSTIPSPEWWTAGPIIRHPAEAVIAAPTTTDPAVARLVVAEAAVGDHTAATRAVDRAISVTDAAVASAAAVEGTEAQKGVDEATRPRRGGEKKDDDGLLSYTKKR